jgi:hypothetical protein
MFVTRAILSVNTLAYAIGLLSASAVLRAQEGPQPQVSVADVAAPSTAGPHKFFSYNPGFFTSENWCKDTGTLCWSDPKKSRALTGIRFIGEPNTGGLSQSGNNRVEISSLVGIIKAGVEINLFGAAAAFQGSFIPQSTVTLDTDSELVTTNRLSNPDRKIGVNYGYTVGLALINGIIATGYGRLNLDTRRITAPTADERHLNFFFLNIQPISTIRAAIGGS